jgi:hypothetical protein
MTQIAVSALEVHECLFYNLVLTEVLLYYIILYLKYLENFLVRRVIIIIIIYSIITILFVF